MIMFNTFAVVCRNPGNIIRSLSVPCLKFGPIAHLDMLSKNPLTLLGNVDTAVALCNKEKYFSAVFVFMP